MKAGEPPLPSVPAQPPAQPPAPQIPESRPSIPQPAAAVEAAAANSAPARSAPAKATPISVNGLSILGLSNDAEVPEESHKEGPPEREEFQDPPLFSSVGSYSTRNVQYLLEDDEPAGQTNWRLYMALALLAAAAGTMVWHWQTKGYPWEQLAREREARRAARAAAAAAAPPLTAEPVAPTPKPSPGSVAMAEPAEEFSRKQEQSQTAPSPAPEVSRSAPAEPQAAAATAPAVRPSLPPVETQSEPAKQTPAIAKKAAPRAPEPASLPLQTANPVPVNDPAHLYDEGEKYLYGDGVAQDCDRAQKNLRTSAAHSYPQAESLLGTMYASGHCLGRDLPAAYRWYARALRHEPANTRIASDLQVLWSQMTPAERKAAQSGGQ